jgi:hypothetical protein
MESERFVGGKTTGLLYVPADYVTPRRGLGGVWRRHLVANAAVRDREYMEALFRSHFPHGQIIEVEAGRVPTAVMNDVDNIVLLFPDPIGIDFRWIEHEIASRAPSKSVFALNGRRRFFRLDSAMRRRLAFRRFLAAVRIPEMSFLLIFVIATPFLTLFDFMRGRR